MGNTHLRLVWTARITGLVVFLFFTVSTGASFSWWSQTKAETGESSLYVLMALAFFGYIWTWYRLRHGAWMILISGLLLVGIFLMAGDIFPLVCVALPVVFTGLCFMAAAAGWLV